LLSASNGFSADVSFCARTVATGMHKRALAHSANVIRDRRVDDGRLI
jgi:hypothetical protein